MDQQTLERLRFEDLQRLAVVLHLQLPPDVGRDVLMACISHMAAQQMSLPFSPLHPDSYAAGSYGLPVHQGYNQYQNYFGAYMGGDDLVNDLPAPPPTVPRPSPDDIAAMSDEQLRAYADTQALMLPSGMGRAEMESMIISHVWGSRAIADSRPPPSSPPIPTGSSGDFTALNPMHRAVHVSEAGQAAPGAKAEPVRTSESGQHSALWSRAKTRLLSAAKTVRTITTLAKKYTWKKPSKEKAEEYADQVHPRQVDTKTFKLKPWPVFRTKMGRHWPRWCKCCDPFAEGEKSTLAMYGAGITNYFKTLKWLCATMFLMGMLFIPSIMLNVYADNTTASIGDIELYKTTIGHLGSEKNVTTVNVPFTDCGGDMCTVSKAEVARLYAICDASATCIFLLAFLWLMYFQRKESIEVDKYTVTPEDYSVQVRNLPENVTEEMIQAHFQRFGEVHRVYVVEDNRTLMKMFVQRGKLVKQLERISDKLRSLRSQNKDNKQTRKVKVKLKQTRSRFRAVERRIDGFHARSQPRILSAFVTFEKENSQTQCVLAYSGGFLGWLFQGKQLRLQGKRLKVHQAESPSTILWENMTYGKCSQLGRRTVTTFISILTLLFSFGLLFYSSVKQRQVAEDASPECPDPLPVHINSNFVQSKNASSTDIDCYCESLSTSQAVRESVCSDWLQRQSFLAALAVVGVCIVIGTNAFLNVFLKKLTVFEKHHSVTGLSRSLALRLFLLSFVNTAMVVVLVNAALPGLEDVADTAKYNDFETKWYITVGTSILMTMMLNVFSIHIAPIGRCILQACKRKCKNPTSQRDLNTLYTGPEFHLHVRYAQMINMLFVTLVFAAGLPLLVPIAFFWGIFAYWIDKTMFLRFYRTPPRFDVDLAVFMTSFLPIAVILHLGFAIWMYGNSEIFVTEEEGIAGSEDVEVGGAFDTALERASKRHTFPLFAVMIGLAVTLLLRFIVRTLFGTLKRTFTCLTCAKLISLDSLREELRQDIHVPPYAKARQLGQLIGVPSYNLLEHPRFADSFALPPNFAQKHFHLADILRYHRTAHMMQSRSKNQLP